MGTNRTSKGTLLHPGQEVIVVGENGCMDHVGSKGVVVTEAKYTGPVCWYTIEVFDRSLGEKVHARMRRCDLETEDEYRAWMAEEEVTYG